jgi:hypothetical protein
MSKYLTGDRGFYQTQNLFNPLTNKAIKRDSIAFKLLSNFSYDKDNNILIPNDKSNFTFNEYLNRWLSNDYGRRSVPGGASPSPKIKKKDLKPDDEELALRKKYYDMAYSEDKPIKFAKAPKVSVSFTSKMEEPIYSNTKNKSEMKTQVSQRDSAPLFEHAVREVDILKNTKPAAESYDSFSKLNEVKQKKPRKPRKKMELEGISDITSDASLKIQKKLADVVRSREYQNIIELLQETKNKLYHDYDNKKRIKFTVNDEPQNKLISLFRTFENINSLAKLKLAVKNYNNIFSTFKFEEKAVAPFSTSWFYARDHDEILNSYGRTIN